jgi:hypothetical protein
VPVPTLENIALFFLVIGVALVFLGATFVCMRYLNKQADQADT